MKEITKKYLVVYSDSVVTLLSKNESSFKLYTNKDYFECDNKDELLERLEGLKLTDEQQAQLDSWS